MRHRLQGLAYANKLYQMVLSGPVPKVLRCVPNDPWPGDAAAGRALVDGLFSCAGQRFSAHPPLWLPGDLSARAMRILHGFSWLRDLRAVGGDTARRLARSLLASWYDQFSLWTPLVWDPVCIAERLTHSIGLHDFFLASADDAFRARTFTGLAQQHRHLQRLAPRLLEGVGGEAADSEGIAALQGIDCLLLIRGLVFAGVALIDGEKSLDYALHFLPTLLQHRVLADGCCVERSPSTQMTLVRVLLDIRHALKMASIALPPELPLAIDRATLALRFFRHGDGGLALFHGGHEENPVAIDALLTHADRSGRPPKSLPHSGYERLQAVRMLVIVDRGDVPPVGSDALAHASFGSFELSLGRERLLVNSGAAPSGQADAWHHALAATAAHTTLTLHDRNLAELLPQGGIGRRPQRMYFERSEADGHTRLALNHDGYKEKFGTLHYRQLVLMSHGEELRGSDTLEGRSKLPYSLRFHLHPDVQAALIQQNQAVLLRLPSGGGWRLRAESGSFSLEESLYYGKTNPRPSQQIVLRGITGKKTTTLNWFLTKEKNTRQ